MAACQNASVQSSIRKGKRVIVVNVDNIPGYEIVEIKALVQGNAVMAKHLGRDIGAALKNIIGGELRAYTQLLANARDTATDRMIAQAEDAGATAIINVRYTTSAITENAAEIHAYGTAVVARSV